MVYRIILRSECTPSQTGSGNPVLKTRLVWTGDERLQSVLQVSPKDHTTNQEDRPYDR